MGVDLAGRDRPKPAFAAMDPEPAEEVVGWMVDQAVLAEDHGMLSFGSAARTPTAAGTSWS